MKSDAATGLWSSDVPDRPVTNDFALRKRAGGGGISGATPVWCARRLRRVYSMFHEAISSGVMSNTAARVELHFGQPEQSLHIVRSFRSWPNRCRSIGVVIDGSDRLFARLRLDLAEPEPQRRDFLTLFVGQARKQVVTFAPAL